jgi:hypothetical protein
MSAMQHQNKSVAIDMKIVVDPGPENRNKPLADFLAQTNAPRRARASESLGRAEAPPSHPCCR